MGHPIREQRIRQRLNWFRKAQELGSVTDACVFFGISRKTYYKWWHRYAASRWDRLSLADRSRRPHRHPRQVGTRMARRLRRWTGYGARRLAWHLRRKGVPHVPSVYGIPRVLQRAGLLTGHRTRPKHRQRYVMPRPGDCVQVDITYVPYRVDGRQAFQYTALDDCTRLRVVRFFPELTNSAALAFLAALRGALPFRVQQVETDNDATFTNWDHERAQDRADPAGATPPLHPRLRGGRDRAPLHPATEPAPEREGRAEPPDRYGGVLPCAALSELRGPGQGPPPLQSVLQHGAAPWGPRGPDAPRTAPGVSGLSGAPPTLPVGEPRATAGMGGSICYPCLTGLHVQIEVRRQPPRLVPELALR